MCREVLDIEPYQYKLSPERGKAWETIASHLNATSNPKFRVTQRSFRDRYNFLTKKFQIRLNRKERASGISDDNSELDNLLEEILEKEKAAKEKLDNDVEDKRKNLLGMRRRQLKIYKNVHWNGLGKQLNERARKRDRRQKSPSR